MKNASLIISSFLLLTACASTRLRPEAEGVIVSTNPAATGCKKVGSVESHTHVNVSNSSNTPLINLLKNNAHDLGGNYVHLEEANNLKHSGQVYSCP